MKRILLFTSVFALLISFVGCSSDDGDTQQPVSTVVEVINDPVEIHLGLPDGVNFLTRAALEDDSEDLDIGVFCLAREHQNVNNQAQSISWWDTSVSSLFSSTFCLMNNVESVKSGSEVTWKDGLTRYYPFTQFYSYDFYGYYPYVANNEGDNSIDTTTVNRVEVRYAAIDGKTDILWGRATSSESYAYSAKYFRQPGNQSVVPMMHLDHMLTRLKFQVVPGESYVGSGDYTAASTMIVTGLKVVDVVKNVTLLVADYDTDHANENGSDVLVGTDEPERLQPTDSEVQTLSLCAADGEPFDEVQVSDNPAVAQQLGESIMLYPAAKYTLQISMRDTNNTVFRQDHPLELISPTGLFNAGCQYTITIEVHGPKEVDIKAQLTPWQDPGLTEEQQDAINLEL